MAAPFHRVKIAEGVSFTAVQDSKFKHNRLSVSMILPLEEGKLAERAIVPYILRQGTRNYPDVTKINERLSDLYGASLEASVEKFGAYQLLNIGMVGIDSRFAFEGEDMVRELASQLADILLDPYLENGAFSVKETELEKEYLKDTIEAEINDKRNYAIMRCKSAMCDGEKLALFKLGTIEEVEAITPQSAYKAYLELLDTAQIEFILCGSGDPETACEEFRSRFDGVERHPVAVDLEICRKLPTVKEKDITETMAGVTQGKLVLAFRSETTDDPAEQAAARMAIVMLGGTGTSLLHVNVREKLSLCYYCMARMDSVTGIMLIDSGVEAENCDKTKAACLEQLQKLQNGDFEDKLLSETKLFMKTAFSATGDSLGALETWYLTKILCDSMETPMDTLAYCQAVSREEVVAAAQKLKLDTVYRLIPEKEAE